MSYLVFARKYRPQTFESVVAQEHVTRTLRNALSNDRVGSGYLFCGPRGTGKTTVARLLAKASNCVDGPTDSPCGNCPACKEIAAGVSLDVLEIDAASNTGVDDVRALRENVRYLPTNGKKRIFIIDEIHRLSGSAFDALLKTLEEPPPHVIFIFATTEPLKVPETILSRTQRFDFRRIGVDDLARHLKKVASEENLTLDDAAVNLLARKADGSVRDSLSLLDQIAAFSGDRITVEDIVDGLGLVDRQALFDFVNAIAETDKGKALRLVKRLFDGGVDVADFVAELMDHLRSLLILATDKEAGELLNLAESELAEYSDQAEHFSVGDILRFMKIISDLNTDLKSGLDERLLLEVAAVKMADLESTVRLEEVLAQISAGGGASTGIAGDSDGQPDIFGTSSQKKKIDPDLKSSSPVTGGRRTPETEVFQSRAVNLAQVKASWDTFLQLMRQNSQMLASQLSMAEVRAVKENELTLVFAEAAEPSRQLVSKTSNLNLITQSLRAHYKVNLRIRFEVDPNKANPQEKPRDKHSPAVDAKTLVEKSPRLQKLLKMVDGEVIGVKQVDDNKKR